MTSEHLTAARAALADEINDATQLRDLSQQRIDRANAAIDALYGDDPVPLVRPPAPDVEQPGPVEVPKPAETRPKKVETRPRPVETRPAAGTKVPCPDCGHEIARAQLTNHRRHRHGATSTETSSKYNLEEIARVAREAIAAGNSGPEAVATTFGVSKGNAGLLLTRARHAGHTVPRAYDKDAATQAVQAVTLSPDAAERILACEECEFELAAIDGAKRLMSSHTIKAHHRGPRGDELNSVPKGRAA